MIRKVKNVLMLSRDRLVADVRSRYVGRYVMHRLMHPVVLTYILRS